MFFKLALPSAPAKSTSTTYATSTNATAANKLLRQSLALAALLHIWLVLMFGNAMGTARPGDGVWGRINVTLAGAKGDASEADSSPRQSMTALPSGPVGQARQQRFGGTVRPLEEKVSKTIRPTTPGAAEVGVWSEQRVEAAPQSQPMAVPPVSPLGLPTPTPNAAPTSPALMMAAPATVTPAAPVPMADLGLAVSQAPTPLAQAPLPTSKVMVMEAGGPAAGVTRSKQDAIGRAGDGPRRLSQQPMAPSPLPILPQFKPALGPAPKLTPLAPIVAEPIAAPMLAAADALAPLPTLPSPLPLPSVAEPVLTQRLSAPAALPRQARSELQALPAEASSPSSSLAPTPTLAAVPASAAAAAAAPAVAPSSRAAQPSSTSATSAASPSPSPSPAALTAAPSGVPAVPQAGGAPEAGPRLGVDVATPASTPLNAPRLNLNLPRPRGGELSSRGSSGVLDLLPTPPERKSKLSEEMEKAGKEDCRKAYGEKLGLLAVVPLVLDAAKSHQGCRW